jgi:hypothetical protein
VARRIRIEVGDAAGVAVLLEEKAPVACRKIWDALPIEGQVRHARWSGGAGYVIVGGLADAAYRGAAHPQLNLPENFNSFLQIGTLNYIAAHGELLLCYEQAQSRGPEGNQWAARVADLEGDRAPLFAALASIQHKGALPIKISAQSDRRPGD